MGKRVLRLCVCVCVFEFYFFLNGQANTKKGLEA